MSGDIITPDPVHTPAGKPASQPQETSMTPDPLLRGDGKGGYGVVDGSARDEGRPHDGGDPRGDGDAQYGASPIRTARYQEDHDVRDGKKHHRTVQPGKHDDPPGQKS